MSCSVDLWYPNVVPQGVMVSAMGSEAVVRPKRRVTLTQRCPFLRVPCRSIWVHHLCNRNSSIRLAKNRGRLVCVAFDGFRVQTPMSEVLPQTPLSNMHKAYLLILSKSLTKYLEQVTEPYHYVKGQFDPI